ncbi:ATP-binding protein (plasmid) [Haloarcula sp. NS06]|uniref:ATP-binding protein n=1 Tax=Haloarcula sp. NS06 TaxID=3409688 RepID=UPI003DA754C1
MVDLNEETNTYRREYEQWEAEREDLATELREVDELLEDIGDGSWSEDSPPENADLLLSTLEATAADLRLATEVHNAKADREDCVDDIDSVLTKWRDEKSVEASTDNETIRRRIEEFHDWAENAEEITTAVEEREQLETQVTNRLDSPSTREVFAPLRDDDEPWIEVTEVAADEFADEDAIGDRIRDIQGEIGDLEDRRDEIHEECLELERERDQLASEDDLREAQAQIDDGRVEFERVGEAYAVNRIAEEMISQLHERLMEDVIHSLVDETSEIFSSITQEYDGIELDGELQDLEFRALRSNGPHHGVGELSRATAEQLFLAVRLARIRQIEVELPVILDDAATNFDPDHISRVFDVIGELSVTNQVFFLTCHPEFVNLSSECGSSAQYWWLEDGVFTRTDDSEGLKRRLMAD